MFLLLKRTLIVVGALFAFVGIAQARSSAHTARLAPLPRVIAVGNLPGCLQGTLTNPAPQMRKFHATVLRVIVNSAYSRGSGTGTGVPPGITPAQGIRGEALPCIRAARRQGYKVMLVINWNSAWSPRQVASFFSSVLRIYRPYLWAVGVGNEQELQGPKLSGSGYSRDWKAVLPVLKRMAPRAIRVGGEISPYGLSFLQAALRAGLPGMQALAVHPYAYRWEFTIPQVLQLARRYHAALWADEGLYGGPASWRPTSPPGAKFMSLSSLRGAALAGVWLR
jgi:hypothetical protein